MFAVKGWSITAPVKKQTAPNPQKSDGQAKPSGKAKPAKNLKRKRDKEEHVTEENIASLWQRHMEVGVPQRSAKQKHGEEEIEKQSGKPTQTHKEKPTHKQKQKKSKGSRETTGEQADKSEGNSQSPDAVPPSKDLSRDVHQEVTRKKKKKKKKNITKGQEQDQVVAAITTATTTNNNKTSTPFKQQEPALTPLQASMRAKLTSARFRHLNEKLYTTPSAGSLALFIDQPILFDEYHAGFRQQVSNWPENPVDTYIEEIKRRGAIRRPPNPNLAAKQVLMPLPRSAGTCTIADLGCGDARLSSSLQPYMRKLNVKILSYDLHAPHSLVTAADMANLPLADGQIDIAVFCLALMGTNWPDFIDEAYRVLRWHGELWIAEIKSRFSRAAAARNSGGIGKLRTEPEDDIGANLAGPEVTNQTDVSLFLSALQTRGFVLAGPNNDAVDLGNKMFVKMRFLKSCQPTRGKNVQSEPFSAKIQKGKRQDGTRKKFIERDVGLHTIEIDETIILKPCVYKLR